MSVKLALKYSGRDVSAIKAIAQASKKRSLADFQQVLILIFINHSNFLAIFRFMSVNLEHILIVLFSCIFD